MSGTVGLDLRLTDGQGAPVTGAEVLILPMMPAHGHIEPQETATPVAGTPGLYHTSANLRMGGGWLMNITITPPGGSPITVRTDASFDVTDPLATPTPAGGGADATPTATPRAP